MRVLIEKTRLKTKKMNLMCIYLVFLVIYSDLNYVKTKSRSKMSVVFSWKQISYNFNGVKYLKNADYERKINGIHFNQELEDAEKFFIQYNNILIGLEVYEDRVFVTVPRRRHGIPSTLNYVYLHEMTESSPPLLRPYPDVISQKQLVSVYRPRVDKCGRLWGVDTGLLEVPGARKQIQQPAIVIYDLKTNAQILRYELKNTDLVNERTSGGLTSITVDVDPSACDDAYAYINDLATEGLIVFSTKKQTSWRISHPSFVHDENALNFTVAGHVINWRDGLFSIALTDADASGKKKAFYHPLMSNDEYCVDTQFLKEEGSDFNAGVKHLGNRGPLSQSGSHDYHSATRTVLFGNVAQDAILCWNIDTPLSPENVAIVAQDHNLLVYISDLKIVDDYVWVLVNQIPRFVYSTLNATENNYYILKGKITDLIKGTPCERKF